ncbi:MAG: hypothetical protein HYR91_11155 [Flavobacteriia bacterium]|nr:hypothetical protein [Flavobacteriia bacterium]
MKIIRKTIVSLLIVFTLLFAIEKAYDLFLLRNTELKNSFVANHSINAAILIHGTCVPYTMLIPDSIKAQTGLKTYNLADYHSDYAENYLSLYLYLKKNKNPKYLFLYASPECFDETYNEFNSLRYSYFMDDKLVNEVIKDMNPNYYKWTFIPFFKYTFDNKQIHYKAFIGLNKIRTKNMETTYPTGYYPAYDVKNNKYIHFKSAYPKGHCFKWSKKRAFYLKKIIELAQKRNFRIILYESPILHSYAKQQRKRIEIIQKIKSFAKHNKIDFITFDTLAICSNKSNFITTVALTNEASEKFSSIFGKYIQTKYLK